MTRLKTQNKIKKTNIEQWHLCLHTTGKINGITKKTILEANLRLAYLGQTDGSVGKAAKPNDLSSVLGGAHMVDRELTPKNCPLTSYGMCITHTERERDAYQTLQNTDERN